MLSSKDLKQRIVKGDIIVSPLSDGSIKDFEIDITASCFAWLIPYKEDENEPLIVFPIDSNDNEVDYTRWVDTSKKSGKQKGRDKYRIQGLLNKMISSKDEYRLRVPARRTIAIVANEAIYLNNEVCGSGKQVMDLISRGLSYKSSPVRANSVNRLYVYLTNVLDKDVYVDVNEIIMRIHLWEAKTPVEENLIRSKTNAESILNDYSIPTFFKDNEFVVDFLKCNLEEIASTMRVSACYNEIKKENDLHEKIQSELAQIKIDEQRALFKTIVKEEHDELIKNLKKGRLPSYIANSLLVVIFLLIIIATAFDDVERRALFSTIWGYITTIRGAIAAIALIVSPVLYNVVSNIITPIIVTRFKKRRKNSASSNVENGKDDI